MIDLSKVKRTRDGTKVLYVHDSGIDCSLPIVAWLEGLDGPTHYNADGHYFPGEARGTYDLIEEPDDMYVVLDSAGKIVGNAEHSIGEINDWLYAVTGNPQLVPRTSPPYSAYKLVPVEGQS